MELKRVLFRAKMVTILVLMLLLNGFLYIKTQYDSRYDFEESIEYRNRIRMECQAMGMEKSEEYLISIKQELYDTDSYDERMQDQFLDIDNIMSSVIYVRDYKKTKEEIYTSAAEKNQISIYADTESYSYHESQKGLKDFQHIRNLDVSFGNDDALTSVLEGEYTTYFILIFLLLVVIAFFDEQQHGLWLSIYAMKQGREHLIMRRFGILTLASLVVGVLMYIEQFVLAFYFYGVPDFHRLIQSCQLLGEFIIPMDTKTFIIVFILFKSICLLFVALLVWGILLCMKSRNVGLLVTVLLFAIEYLLYRFIEPQSILNLFKYINLFYFIRAEDFFLYYRNLHLFGNPVGRMELMLFLLVVGILSSAVFLILCGRKIRPIAKKSRLTLIYQKITYLWQRGLEHLPAFCVELYKILIWQKGIVVLLIFVIISLNARQTYSFTYKQSVSYMKDFMQECQGSDFTKAENYIQRFREECEIELETYGDNQHLKVMQEELSEMESRLSYVNAMKAAGENVWIIDDTGYSRTFKDYETADTANMVITLMLIILCSGIYSFERKSAMMGHLRSVRGKTSLFAEKMGIAAILILFLCMVRYGVDIYNSISMFGITTLDAPVKSIPCMASSPFRGSIGMFLIELYVYRYLLLMSIAGVVIYISSYFKQEKTIIIGCAILILPAVMAYMGLPFFEYISVIKVISVLELLHTIRGVQGLLPGMLILLLGIACWWESYKRWVYQQKGE